MNFQRQSLPPGLYLVGVPIGTARDITLRALDVLASAEILAAEDTRSLRKLMDIHGIPLEGRRILALHDHSGQGVQERLIEAAKSGQSVAYASEAGMPLIADPGFELVRAASSAGVKVTSAPGPSAVPTALAIGGLPTDAFHFAGFLPQSKAARRKALAGLADIAATLVLFESPKRLASCLADAAEMLGTDRQAAICRELTKKFEETQRGTLAELAERIAAHPVKGEIVLLIDRASDTGVVNEDLVDSLLNTALESMSLKDAVAQVMAQTGLKRREIYQRALDIQSAQSGDDT
ncbi:16S rRNA (cytidine(1402)-2'-O)-methyltransferase [Aliishimia ponticola]|uniref:Ribosomal RNA small subunit methyltransferase I n=1 Tax=Aliishimia ponticola TaxID=2499833 RepID=A0A4S4NA04_9RHOB|nr:16S rRNA (cytidine(1402)-2'-O)-methyltransferase [Aliishimia ponticola]THH35247.1 16S rRNA (cytidine(1402)-2'-O)-methyltransferase [Aliishimia ponticola]